MSLSFFVFALFIPSSSIFTLNKSSLTPTFLIISLRIRINTKMASSSSSSTTVTPTALILLLLITIATLTTQSTAAFTCSGTSPRATCKALVDYVSPNATTLSAIEKLFSVKKLNDLLGANNLDADADATVTASQRIRIPFHCVCVNGTGVSNRTPVYTVKADDGLDHIARDIFAAIVTYQEIAAVNGLPDVNKIEAGQKLWIPIPCSCDAVDGAEVVHYGHVVQAGSSVEAIAATYGTTEETLLKLNGMTNASDLKAAQLLDVPLKACSSSVRNDSLDSPLLVPNATYVITANQCVKCKCGPANNFTLQCEPSLLKPQHWSSCPPTQCNESNVTALSLGNSTTSGTCNSTSCAYTGYNNQTIFTALVEHSTCPASNSNRNGAIKMSVQAWNWNFVLISFHLVLITLALFN